VKTRSTLDVSELPHVGWDAQSPLWWANTIMLVIETAMFGILFASYLYIRMNFEPWPPPQINHAPAYYNTAPDLPIGTFNTVWLVVSCIPAFLLDRAARRLDTSKVRLWMATLIAMGLVAIGLRFAEFPHLHFGWDENAYAGVIWMLLGMHLMHLIVATMEAAVLGTHAFRFQVDEKHAVDITTTPVYWYWVVGMWILIYGVVYFGARVL
jgi:heme/copper-type cytochrome/quinol oxidase subunit 3